MLKNRLKLGDIIEFRSGINVSRLSTDIPKSYVYSFDDLMSDISQIGGISNIPDLGSNYDQLHEGELILGLASCRASIITKRNTGKILKNTEAKCIINESYEHTLDLWYLCYFFNEDPIFKESISNIVVGTTARFITISRLQNLYFCFPNIKKQRKIGIIYKDICRLEYLRKKRDMLQKELLLNILNKSKEQ